MIAVVITLIVYFACIGITWYAIHKFSKYPDEGDVFLMFLPLVNIMYAIALFVTGVDLKKFFKK